MPATAWPQFVGGLSTSRSPTMDAEQCTNLYAATVESQTNVKQKVLFSTPGLAPLLEVGTTSCRGMFSQDGRTWAAVGALVYELDLTANTATLIGTIADDGDPVSWASNGRGGEQLLLVGGGEVKVFDLLTNVLSAPIVLPLTNLPVQCAFLDGYFLLLEADTVRCWFSALEDGEMWDALDFFARSQVSDNLVAMTVLRDRVWVLGSESTELFFDSGDADVPFVPYPGAIIHTGISGPWAWATDGQFLYWLATSDQGQGYFVQASDGQVQTISTDSIDFAISGATTFSDVEALSYFDEGHQFLVWTLPSCGTCGLTLAYDPGQQLFHQRAFFDQTLGIFTRWQVRGIASTEHGLICGDYSSGDVYRLSLDTFTDNGNAIRRVRRAPYLSPNAEIAFVDQVELGAQVGVGLNSGQGSDPTVLLRLSRDAGMTWTPTVSTRLGAMGQYGTRAVWHRLGRVRLDRLVMEVSVTDAVKVAFGPGLWLRLTQGNGQL